MSEQTDYPENQGPTSQSRNLGSVLSDAAQTNIPRRNRLGKAWRVIFLASTIIGIIALTLLLVNILNSSAGYMAIEYEIEPESLAVDGVPLQEMPNAALVQILQDNLTRNRFRTLDGQTSMDQRTQEDLVSLVYDNVIEPKVQNTWPLIDSLAREAEIREEANRLSQCGSVFQGMVHPGSVEITPIQQSTAGWRAHGNPGLVMDYQPHHPVRLAHRNRGSDLSGRIFSGYLDQPDNPDKYQQSGRRAIHHLWHVRPGSVCPCVFDFNEWRTI